jgi:hypothetical protein
VFSDKAGGGAPKEGCVCSIDPLDHDTLCVSHTPSPLLPSPSLPPSPPFLQHCPNPSPHYFNAFHHVT